MPFTRDFRETVKARADRDPEFRAGLYREAVHGELGTAKILLRDVINASVGFDQLGRNIGIPEKLLMRTKNSQTGPAVTTPRDMP